MQNFWSWHWQRGKLSLTLIERFTVFLCLFVCFFYSFNYQNDFRSLTRVKFPFSSLSAVWNKNNNNNKILRSISVITQNKDFFQWCPESVSIIIHSCNYLCLFVVLCSSSGPISLHFFINCFETKSLKSNYGLGANQQQQKYIVLYIYIYKTNHF